MKQVQADQTEDEPDHAVVLDVPASSCEEGCVIITYPNYGTDNQKWKIHEFHENLQIQSSFFVYKNCDVIMTLS